MLCKNDNDGGLGYDLYKNENNPFVYYFFLWQLSIIKKVDLEDAFRAADKDQSGRITLDEWIEVLKASGQDVSRYLIITLRCKTF